MSYNINVKRFHYAILTKDENGELTYSDVIPLPDVLREIGVTPNTSNKKFYAEGRVVVNKTQISSIDLEVELSKIPFKVLAEWLGYSYDKGVIEEKDDAVAPWIAVGFSAPQDDGNEELVWFYKCKAEVPSKTYKQKEEDIDFQPEKIKLNCVPRRKDGKIRKFADTSVVDFDDKVATSWFTAVPAA